MAKYSFLVAIFCAAFMLKCSGMPYNDISIDCDSMLPDQGSAPQTSSPPYVVAVSFDRYDPGNEIQVILEGTSPFGFKAFMVQAREVNGNVPLGSFYIIDPNTQGIPCANMSNSAVRHTSPNVKHRIVTTWVAPQVAKKIRLMATFVQDYDVYWVGVHSKTLSPRNLDMANNSKASNESVATNSSDIASDSIASMVSEIIADSDETDENNEEIDLNTLLPDSEADNESEIPTYNETTDGFKPENVTGRSRRKSLLSLNINCGEGAVSQSSNSACVKNVQGGSESSSSQSKVIVVKQGSGSGCAGGGVASVYNQYGCKDNAAGASDQSSYGQSVSTSTGTKVKVVTYPDSKPYPPERDSSSSKITNPGIIYSQGSKPQSGSSESIRITVQSGQSVPACDKSSSSYNVQTCKQQSQLSSSQSGSSLGTQGSSPQSGSSESIRVTIKDQPSNSQPSNSQTGNSIGSQQGGSYSGSSSSCGQQGTTYESNPCHQDQSSSSSSSSSSSQSTYSQAGSQPQGNPNACTSGKDAASYNYNKC